MNYQRLKKMYLDYGFELRKEHKDFLAFEYKSGIFSNIEIIKKNDTQEVKDYSISFQESGFAVTTHQYENCIEANNRLFKGFFNYDRSIRKLSDRYDEFRNKIELNLNVPYQYIESPYMCEGDIGEGNITEVIRNDLLDDGAKLIIVEAAAGFGKTCTAFEILSTLITNGDSYLPLFVELSRNRMAPIFKYVLLTEIDINYPTLNSTLVESEIYSGNIPVIIDGFDELITKSSEHRESSTNEEVFEEVETMLETISHLLKNNAKVILTSRKSSLFVNESFEEWAMSKMQDFKVKRFVLSEPSVNDWLDQHRIGILNSNNIVIESILNPVILSYLKSLEINDFVNIVSCQNRIIDCYFSTLLEREKYRQALSITEKEQLSIFKNLSYSMASNDISSASREYIKDIIIRDNRELLKDVRERYSAETNQSVDSLANTLSNHVLLDRVSSKNQIGFVNEFVFGTLLGDSIISRPKDDLFTEKFIDIMSTAYSSRNPESKKNLFAKIEDEFTYLDANMKLHTEINLLNEVTQDYIDSTFIEQNIKFIDFSNIKFDTCVFNNCKFEAIVFKLSSFKSNIFFNCMFTNCTVEVDVDIKNAEFNQLYDCKCFNSNMNALEEEIINTVDLVTQEDDVQMNKRLILEHYWPKGRKYAQRRRRADAIIKSYHCKLSELALQELIRDKILVKYGETYVLDIAHLDEIKKILGREV